MILWILFTVVYILGASALYYDLKRPDSSEILLRVIAIIWPVAIFIAAVIEYTPKIYKAIKRR